VIINLLRPEDLLVLSIEAHNLRLDASHPQTPELVIVDQAKSAFLVVRFQPQAIAEQAFFEVAPKTTQSPKFDTNAGNATPPPLQQSDDPLLLPGSVQSRIAYSSRLVFRLPAHLHHIPYTIEALLNWSQLELVVSPLAGVPDDQRPHPGYAISPPKPLETALELPYRLILSPNRHVAWSHALQPVTHRGRTELWHTRIARLVTLPNQPLKIVPQEASDRLPVPLRAIWSPDFVRDGPLPPHTLDDVPFRSSMSPRDRDQIVILTSGFDGYFVKDQATGAEKPFIPTPVHAARLHLSALGAWLNSRGNWTTLPYYYYFPFFGARVQPVDPPPVQAQSVGAVASRSPNISARPHSVTLPVQGLDLSEWVHQSIAGRDQCVRIVYEGYLYPFGHRASLVKVTERKVVGSDIAPGGSPVAYLRQRMYIIVREHEKTFPANSFLYSGREMPFLNRVRINTLVTPNIDAPIWLGTASFWVTVDNVGFLFHITIEDLEGTTCDLHAQLIFVSDSETNVNVVKTTYVGSGDQRVCRVRGHNIAYADPHAGDTVLKTTSLYFDTQLQPPNTPEPSPPFFNAPFIPCLDLAGVSIPALAELVGASPVSMIKLYLPYLKGGLDSNAGVFAEIVDAPPAVKFTANKAGGFATPNLGLTALSARKGLVGGSADDAAAGLINPGAFFNDTQAKLFGTIPIGELIPVDASGKTNAAQNAPEIRTHILPSRRHPKKIVTQILWQPQLTNYTKDPINVNFNEDGDQSALVLHARFERQLDGSPPLSNITGKLTNFRVELLGVIGIKISSIIFTSKNGSKTNVTARLSPRNTIAFEGPLKFVQTLADILPSGIFGGSGPAIDLTPTALRIAYTLGLPPISIGVFSLEHISITTGLDLPYLDGKPSFEFAFAKRNAPFILTVECLGGGGFVHLVLDADGIQMVEGALEFGGEFSLDLGVASGGVHIMAGIYFQLKGSDSDLTGFVDIGGEVSVLGIISISIDLNLSLSWQHTPQGDKVQGRATLTVSVSVMFFSVSVQLSVERSFGSGNGDPRVGQLIGSQDWARYALAFA
jgi:hypothetical protein